MSGLGLNIHEAHAFSTEDGYFLDVFLVACSKGLVLLLFCFIWLNHILLGLRMKKSESLFIHNLHPSVSQQYVYQPVLPV